LKWTGNAVIEHTKAYRLHQLIIVIDTEYLGIETRRTANTIFPDFVKLYLIVMILREMMGTCVAGSGYW
jgi:hypothetical protein